MIKFLLIFLLFISNAWAIFPDGPVTVMYADGTCSHPDHQDLGLGMGIRIDDLNLRPRGVVHRTPKPSQPEPEPEPPPPDIPPEEPSPVWETSVTFYGTYATSGRIAKYNIGLEMVERVMNENGGNADTTLAPNVFKSRVRAYDSPYTIGGTPTSRGFVAASGQNPINKTNAQIYQHHWDANETRPAATQIDNVAFMEVEFYYANNSTIGYTYSTSKRVWVNVKFYDTYKPSSAMGNFYHEWSHKLGYGHESGSSAYRPYTVPYGIGYIMRDLCVPLNAEYGY